MKFESNSGILNGQNPEKRRKNVKKEYPSKVLNNQEAVITAETPTMSRRKFLTYGGAATISAAAAISTTSSKYSVWNMAKRFISGKIDSLNNRADEILDRDTEVLGEDILESNVVNEPTVEQVEIDKQEAKALCEILDFDQDKIDLNINTYKAVEEYWKERYGEGGNLHLGLEKAYKNIGEWDDRIKEEFKKIGVPEEYAYLAIPESHWKVRARSEKGAAGPYQFIRPTAKTRGLKTGTYAGEHTNIDQRMDPIESGIACAKELKYLYSKSNDWQLALSAYNGGFFWRYKGMINYKKKKGEDVEANYEGFMEYLEKKINTLMTELKENNFHHTVKKGDSLSKIANKYFVDLSSLLKENNLTVSSVIHKKDEIKIPVDKSNARKIYEKEISGYSENLNYPAKFNAVISLIDKGLDVNQKSDAKYDTVKVVEKKEAVHKLKRGETFYSLHRKYKVSVASIEKTNPKLKPTKLREGINVVIPNKVKPTTLYDIAKQYKKPIDRLKALNPSIINYSKPLPGGYEIRV